MAISLTPTSICSCNIVAEFPVLRELGIISANLRTTTEVTLTADNTPLFGTTNGDLSITAYALLSSNDDLKCPARAGVSYNWDRRQECDTSGITTRFIPRGGIKAYREGPITSYITMTDVVGYTSFSASASSGPTTPFIYNTHYDGYNFAYSGSPISVSASDSKNPKSINIFASNNIPLLLGATYYLQSFSWEYTPPNVPTVTYSFLLSYDG